MSPWGRVKGAQDSVGEGDTKRLISIVPCIVCDGRLLAFQDDPAPACEDHSSTEQAKARVS